MTYDGGNTNARKDYLSCIDDNYCVHAQRCRWSRRRGHLLPSGSHWLGALVTAFGATAAAVFSGAMGLAGLPAKLFFP